MLLNKRQLIQNMWLKKLFSSSSILAIVQLTSINLHLISLSSYKTYLSIRDYLRLFLNNKKTQTLLLQTSLTGKTCFLMFSWNSCVSIYAHCLLFCHWASLRRVWVHLLCTLQSIDTGKVSLSLLFKHPHLRQRRSDT